MVRSFVAVVELGIRIADALDARTDSFSLGVVLYDVIIGRRAVEDDTSAAVFEAILNREPPSPPFFRR